MSESTPERPALDDIDGDEADTQVGEDIEPDHDITPEGLAADPSDFDMPEGDEQHG